MKFFSTIGSLILSLLLYSISPAALADTGAAPNDQYFRDLVANRYVEPFRQGNVELWIQAFDENAIALHNHRSADRGRISIEEFGRAVHDNLELAEYDVEVTDIRRSDQWVYTVGTYSSRFVSKSDGSEPFGRSHGKFVLLWERQADQQWRIILDMGNSNQQ
jgi:hypothetical protein